MKTMELEKTYIIKSISTVSDSKIFRLFPEDEKNIEFEAGQFVKISKPNKEIGRAYSIASPPEWEFLEFLIKMIGGKFTSYLDELKEGDKLLVSKAAGHMKYNGEKEAVFIAGGAGISPIMSIIRHIAHKKIKGKFTVFYSTRTLKDMAYYDELRILSESGTIEFVPVFTRERILNYENQHIDIDMIKRYTDIKEKSFFMCGNLKMVSEIRKVLLENGVEARKIKVEGWG